MSARAADRLPISLSKTLLALLLGGGLILGVAKLTQPLAVAQSARQTLAQVRSALPAGFDNDPLAERFSVLGLDPSQPQRAVTVWPARRAGTLTGLAFEVQAPGYGGPIRLLLGLDAEAQIAQVRVLGHTETAGYGAPVLRPAALSALRADGSADQFAGATVTADALLRTLAATERQIKARCAQLAPNSLVCEGRTR